MSRLLICCSLCVILLVSLDNVTSFNIYDSHISDDMISIVDSNIRKGGVKYLRDKVIPIVKNVEGDVHLCSDSLNLVVAGLLNGSVWAAKMVDASSKMPSGLLQGNLVDLGSFDECLSVRGGDYEGVFKGQHCLIDLLIRFQQPPSFLSPGVLKALGNSVPYTFSLCLPSTCSPRAINVTLNSLANEFRHLAHNMTVTVSVKDSDCHTEEQTSFSTMEMVGIVITLGIVVLAVISTIVDLTLTYRDKNDGVSRDVPKALKPLLAFSLYSNGRSLLKTEPKAGTIETLQGLKFLSIAWVLLGHRIKISAAQAPLANLLTLADVLKQWSSMIVLNATLSVDVFFVISGILNTYMYMSSRRQLSLPSQFKIYAHRYIRLTPAFALMMLVTGTWLYRTGSGPLWDRLVGSARDSCSDYWWTGLLYINNYYNPSENCMMQSWYLAVDMQLFWLSPLVLFPLKRRPSVGLAVLAALIIPSIIVPFLVAYIYQIKTPIPISFDTEKTSLEMAVLYEPTHTKTISYVIGMLAGYVLHLIKEQNTSFRQSSVRSALLWASAALAMAWAVFGGHSLFQLDTPYDRWHSSLYIAFFRLAWSAGVAWIIVASATGNGGVVGWMLSWRAFAPLGRLTYCIYLTHVAVILYGVGSLRQPQYFSYYDMVMKFLGELVITTFFAVLLSLTVEAPIIRLENIYMKKPQSTEDRRVSFSETRVTSSSRADLIPIPLSTY